jgi:hypothetical protein
MIFARQIFLPVLALDQRIRSFGDSTARLSGARRARDDDHLGSSPQFQVVAPLSQDRSCACARADGRADSRARSASGNRADNRADGRANS